MGQLKSNKVMLSGPLALLLFLFGFTSVCSASLCPRGKQYLDISLQTCVNCTLCDSDKGLVVLRPCDVHKDTLCGPIEKLKLLLEFPTPEPEHPHRHRHKHNKVLRNLEESANERGRNGAKPPSGPERVAELKEARSWSSESPFTNGGSNWDWQDITLTLAVFVCILFFVVIALYSLYQAKQWRKLKENFDADVEELSARLSLMAAASSEKGEILEPNFNPVHDGNYLNNRCVYLEQLLHVRKDTKMGSDTGNVYIEESNPVGTGSAAGNPKT